MSNDNSNSVRSFKQNSVVLTTLNENEQHMWFVPICTILSTKDHKAQSCKSLVIIM